MQEEGGAGAGRALSKRWRLSTPTLQRRGWGGGVQKKRSGACEDRVRAAGPDLGGWRGEVGRDQKARKLGKMVLVALIEAIAPGFPACHFLEVGAAVGGVQRDSCWLLP